MSSSEKGTEYVPLRSRRSSGAETYDLRVVAKRRDTAVSNDTRITVFDGWEESKGEGYGELRLVLPRGLYTVRLERGGAAYEEVVRHAKPRDLELQEPQRQSALPSFDTADAHEYYSYTAHEQSLKDTDLAAPVFDPARERPGRLFVFVRAASDTEYEGEDLSESLFLHDLDGTRLTDFGPTAAVQDRARGWLALSIPAPAGSYRLLFSGLRPREMIVPVFSGWETQLFVPFEKRPRLAQASVLLAGQGKGFHPDDRIAQIVDAALKGLEAGIDLLPPEHAEMLLHGKFENPMLGLVGAHLLLLHKRPEWEVLTQVLDNLDSLLPRSADVQALRLAVALRRESMPEVGPMAQPPLLRRGLEAVLEAAASFPDLIAEDSLLERIAPYVLADSPWTAWGLPTEVAGALLQDPLEFVRQAAAEELEQVVGKSADKLSNLPLAEVSAMTKSALSGVLARVGPKAEKGLQRGLDQVSEAISDKILEAARSKGDSALRSKANQAVLEGVDAAMRAPAEQASLPAAEALPQWVRNLFEEAKGPIEDKRLESIARRAKLPVRLLRRLISQVRS